VSTSALGPDLIARARTSDPQAISAIYEHYAPAIYRYIYFRVGDAELARDLQSDVFLRMLEGIARYEDRGFPISAWLYRIAHDRTIDTLRRRERTSTIPLDTWSETCDGPDGGVELSDRQVALRRAMAQLGESQRQVLRLRYAYDLSIQETARQMGRTQGSIKSLQHRAQQNLLRLMQEGAEAGSGEGYSFA
jgi:RNA polymerase sigma-70 factor (ECF subfamily)